MKCGYFLGKLFVITPETKLLLFPEFVYRLVLCKSERRGSATQRDRNDGWKNRKIFYPVYKHLETCRKSNKKWLPSKKLKHPSNEMNNQTDIWYPLPLNQVFFSWRSWIFRGEFESWPCKLPSSALKWLSPSLLKLGSQICSLGHCICRLGYKNALHVSSCHIFGFSFLYPFLFTLLLLGSFHHGTSLYLGIGLLNVSIRVLFNIICFLVLLKTAVCTQ